MPPLVLAILVLVAVAAAVVVRKVVVRRRREDERERLRRFVAVIERGPDMDDPSAGASPSRATGADTMVRPIASISSTNTMLGRWARARSNSRWTRGQGAGSGIGDRQLTQLLAEIDGIASSDGVLVVGATNRPDALDPALTRGGRLSRTIELPLPDEALRLAMLVRMTARMPTVGVDLARVAAVTDGMSGADLQAVCQQAAIHALVRVRGAGDPDAAVEVLPEDVARAILEARG